MMLMETVMTSGIPSFAFGAGMFSWKEGVGSADASDLEAHKGQHSLESLFYDGTIWVYSPKTGVYARFDLAMTWRDQEDDVLYWTFVGPTINGKDLSLLIFND